MNTKIIFAAGVAFSAIAAWSASHPAPPIPPNWEPILTRPGALAKGSGHLQGMCVTSNAIYGTLHDGIYKFDWYGRMIMHVRADKHTGDICWWNGHLYTIVCHVKPVPGFDGAAGSIQMFDEDLNLVKERTFLRPKGAGGDGITCLDGVLYIGLSTVALPVQNMTTDGEKLYINFYTPEEEYPCFFVFDKDFKVLQAHVFGWRHGVDLVGGGEPGAVRLIYALSINCWSQASKQQLDPAPSQTLFRYAELKDGKIRDITRYIKFRNEMKR